MSGGWPCLVIAGPTASGKTSLAVDLARRLDTEIFSMDSRQVYHGLDLGTGKDLSEYSKASPPVRYHLIDIVEPEEVYSLFRFQVDAYAALDDFRGRRGPGVPPLLVGGTGLYLEAVLKRYAIAEVPENPRLRADLMTQDVEALKRELMSLNPEQYARTDLTSKKRIVRSLEIALSPRGAMATTLLPDWNLDPLIFVLHLERSRLRERIRDRLHARLRAGLVDEVRAARERGVTWERLALLGMEYRQVAAHLRGEKSHDAMVADLLHEIHLLSKRQETYFRGMERRGLPVHWIDEDARAEDLLEIHERRAGKVPS